MSTFNDTERPATGSDTAPKRHRNQWSDGYNHPGLIATSDAVSKRLLEIGMTEAQLAATLEISSLRLDGLLHRHRSWTVVHVGQLLEILWPDDWDAGAKALVASV